ncbi:MAG: vitamin B12-dependent ribonucleotide reductase, partial [Acidobacteria bacterium]|nr:vitamin B12-dependent ribonucleotide reductase [Acidobacteriota bacterium]
GLMDSLATALSISLQYGVPVKTLVEKLSHTRFEPSGFTKNPQIPIAKSIPDYVARWLASKFLSLEEQREVGVLPLEGGETSPPAAAEGSGAGPGAAFQNQQDAPPCDTCGQIMVRAGNCYKCLNCGATSGCG